MNITFENISKSQAIKIDINNTYYVIEPENNIDISITDDKTVFTAELLPVDFSDAFGEDFTPKGLKEKFLYKASKKFTEKLPEMTLNTVVTYEFASDYNNVILELSDCEYSVADEEIADFFDMNPIVYSFPRAESNFCSLIIKNTNVTNRKRFLKLYRTAQLFIDYYFFIFIYALAKHFTTDKYVHNKLKNFYSVSNVDRNRIIENKIAKIEKATSEKHGHRQGLLKFAIVLLAVGGLFYWAMTSEPDVIISEDFSQIVCYDETFELYNGSIPEDAKDKFLEDYFAERLLSDGEYVSDDGYYCYVYEDSNGDRYMWLKEDWYNKFDRHKTYEDYDNPKIYKSASE